MFMKMDVGSKDTAFWFAQRQVVLTCVLKSLLITVNVVNTSGMYKLELTRNWDVGHSWAMLS